MRADEAIAKRQQWMDKGNPPCQHAILKLLYTMQNYFTGDYVCMDCGYIVGRVSESDASSTP